VDTLAVLKDCMTEEEMIYYNNLVDVQDMSIPNVATKFLEDKKMI
jgi:glycine betaine/choline ABC-type transport system substrate-binding protein